MITESDFSKKQIVIIFANEGEKMAFNNDNLVIKTADGKIKFQCSCYRLFAVYLVGNCSLTTVVLQRAAKFGFFVALFTGGFRLYAVIGAGKDGNSLLRRKQYEYKDLDLARYIIHNKIQVQYQTIVDLRGNSVASHDAKELLPKYLSMLDNTEELSSILAYEGLASKAYFAACFDNIEWKGRQPRIKRDVVNSVLDVGYTLLFAYMDALLECFGFDVYCGVLHRLFYMRKSLVCDLIEPFRPLVDRVVRKGFGLGQIKEEDFIEINHQFKVKYEQSPKYVSLIMNPIIENKDMIFAFVQGYYRCFMKNLSSDDYPYISRGEVKYGAHKL